MKEDPEIPTVKTERIPLLASTAMVKRRYAAILKWTGIHGGLGPACKSILSLGIGVCSTVSHRGMEAL